MASYQSGIDPPTRPDPGWRPPRKMETPRQPAYRGLQQNVPRRPSRGSDDNGHVSAKTELPRAVQNVYGLPSSTSKPGTRRPSLPFELDTKPKSSGPRRPSLATTTSDNSMLQSKHSRNVLRRKPSTISRHAASASQKPTSDESVPFAKSSSSVDMTSQNKEYVSQDEDAQEHDSIVILADFENNAPVIPELDRYRSRSDQSGYINTPATDLPYKLSTHDLPPPTPLNSGLSTQRRYSGFSSNSGYSASPATRFSESPGPGSYSRDTTPTSMSSQSPGILAPSRLTPRMRQASPIHTRPPLSRRRNGSMPGEVEITGIDEQGLPSLRESVTSSSSNSTVKDAGKTEQNQKDKKKKKKRLTPPPPSPPPRKSSQKFVSPRSRADMISPSKTSKSSAPTMMSSTTPPQSLSSKQQAAPSSTESPNRPPSRPSRDGAPELRLEASPIIQSNMPELPFTHQRRRSSGTNVQDSPNRFGPNTNIRPPMQNSSGIQPAPLLRQATPAPAGLGIIPDLRPIDTAVQTRQMQSSRTPSPSASSTKSRFGFFGRRTKTTPDPAASDKNDKNNRKGPAAGTGHEGYGRYAPRGRSGSAQRTQDTRGSNASSQESLLSQYADDPFLRERMSPVIIAGGGEIVENRNSSLDLSRSESSHSLALQRPSIDSQVSSSSNPGTRTTLWPSGLPTNSAANRGSIVMTIKRVPTSDSSDHEGSRRKPTLAARRSMQRLQSTDNANFKLPQPIKIGSAPQPTIDSRDTGIESDDAYYGSSKSRSHKSPPPVARKLTKKPRSPRKWNIFQRSKPQPEPSMPVLLAEHPQKSVAHYALMDSPEDEGDNDMDLEDILREAEVVDLSKALDDDSYEAYKRSQSSGLLSPFEEQTPASEISQPLLSSPEPVVLEAQTARVVTGRSEERTGRPSRLPQVGRIPRVTTARPEQTSPQSFSRPFARVSMIRNAPLLTGIDRQSIALGASPPKSSTLQTQPDPLTGTEEITVRLSPEQPRAFLVISPRKDSAATTSTSSGAMSFAATTAVVPEPDAELGEDEVWDEYNDLLGAEEDIKAPPSATSSHGVPFQYEKYESRPPVKGKGKLEDKKNLSSSSKSVPTETQAVDDHQPPRLALASSSVYSPDFAKRFKDALDAVPSPTTPLSFTDFIEGYGDRNNSMITISTSPKHAPSQEQPNQPQGSGSTSTPALFNEKSRRSIEKPETIPESPAAQVNLRVGSMTVSKWLTFGHVLFSPAREEFLGLEASPKHHSILVIDGLGNDDWSFYAAETYPTATFYNLSPNPSRPTSTHPSSLPSTPPNHRQVQYLSPLSKFPFPREFFSTVVLRFPTACSDAALRNLVAESKRVLKASGYLELSILDLDMVNMGVRCRRAVRALKVRLAGGDPSVSLAPMSDTVLRLMGKRGFNDIKSCTVGVPVASPVVQQEADKDKGGELSLADMMRDESRAGDEGITKMVAKVGRWWFSRCYESQVGRAGTAASESIFSDRKVLEECESWGTSFKLLVCYAQKPVVPRRRTASV